MSSPKTTSRSTPSIVACDSRCSDEQQNIICFHCERLAVRERRQAWSQVERQLAPQFVASHTTVGRRTVGDALGQMTDIVVWLRWHAGQLARQPVLCEKRRRHARRGKWRQCHMAQACRRWRAVCRTWRYQVLSKTFALPLRSTTRPGSSLLSPRRRLSRRRRLLSTVERHY